MSAINKPFIVGLDMLSYVFWVWRDKPTAELAFKHPFAQELVEAEYSGRQIAAYINLVVDLPYQEIVLQSVAFPKCLRYDGHTLLVYSKSIEGWFKGLSMLYSRIHKQFQTQLPEISASVSHSLQAFDTIHGRFDEIFCEAPTAQKQPDDVQSVLESVLNLQITA